MGGLVVDDCGVCDGGNADLMNVCAGDDTSCADECGIPNGDNSSCSDCAGVPNGNSEFDECGECLKSVILMEITIRGCDDSSTGDMTLQLM